MFITLLLFSFLAAADDMASEKYCFASVNQSLSAKQKVAAIQVPSDVVTSDENCLVIQMRPHRRELIQRFVLSSFPGASISFSSEDVQREPCLLKVEKEKIKTAENLDIQLNQYPSVSKTETNGNAHETMQIQTLNDFELSVDQDQIKGLCRYINSNRYEITIEVRKNPKPIVPVALPPGTIVVLNQPPPDQETMVLRTQLQLSRGQKIDIGGAIKDLKYKNTNVDIKPDLKYETGGQTGGEKVWLSLQ